MRSKFFEKRLSFNKEVKQKSSSSNARLVSHAPVSLPQNAIDYFWEPTSSQYQLGSASKLKYDAKGNIIESTSYNPSSGDSLSKTIRAYDTEGNETETIQQAWNGTSWTNTSRYTYGYSAIGGEYSSNYTWNTSTNVWDLIGGNRAVLSYDGLNRVIEEVEQEYDNGTWVNTGKIVYAYASSAAPISITEYAWDNGAYVADERYIDLVWYNFENTQLTSYTAQEYQNGIWVNYGRINISYSSTGNVEIAEEYINGAWELVERDTYTSDAAGNETYLSEMYDNGAWVPEYRNITEVDSHGNVVLIKDEDYIANAWVTTYKTEKTYTYDSNGNAIEEISEDTSPSGTSKSKTTYSDFIQLNITGTTEAAIVGTLDIFPNPSKDFISVETSISQILTAKIYTPVGIELKTISLAGGKGQINISDLSSGIYFLSLQTASGKSVSRKIVKE